MKVKVDEDNITIKESQMIAGKAQAVVAICSQCFRPHIYRPDNFKHPPKTCGRLHCMNLEGEGP